MSNNGKSEVVSTEGMSLESRLELIVQGQIDLSEQLETIIEQQGEIIEKLNNLSLDSDGFVVFDEDEN